VIGKTIKNHSISGLNLVNVEKNAKKNPMLKNNCMKEKKVNNIKLIHCLISINGFSDVRLMPSM